jgi:hypothetical protein
MCSNFSLVSERISKQGAALEVFRLNTVFGRDRQAVVEAYEVRGQIETSTNL